MNETKETIWYHHRGMDAFYKIWHITNQNMLIYMHSDGGSIVCSEKLYPIQEGVLCFVGGRKYHYTMPDEPKDYDRSKVFVSDEELQKILALFPENAGFQKLFTEEAFVYARIGEDQREEVERLYEEMEKCSDRNVFGDVVRFSNYAKLLAYLSENILESVSPNTGLMYRALDFINNNICEDIGVDDICAAVHSSKYHFCRQFKKATGMTVMNYILKTRIVLAQSMLLKEEISIGEVSERCGFSSISYFCRVFKEDTRRTPLQYRRGRE